MPFADSAGTGIYYDNNGQGEPVVLCLPGWCVHHTIFTSLTEHLSAHHRVLTMDWRGHGESQASNGAFGYAEMLDDVLAVIHTSGAQSVVPIAQAHAGWVAVELRRRLGPRVPQIIFTNWNPMFTNDNPLAPSFFDAMQALQDADGWRQTVEQLLMTWLSDAPASVDQQVRTEMGSHGFDDWARAGREIAAAYAREGDPLQALGNFDPPVPALHVYGHPSAPEYLAAQESFAQGNPWFAVRHVAAVSHFPMLEAPDETAGAINDFIISTDEQ